MGAEFVEKATPSFKKSWDWARLALATPDLFTHEPSLTCRTAVAEIIDGTLLRAGERLTVELQDGKLVALRGNTEVAHFNKPSESLLKAVESSCGIAKGTVETVYDLARVAEISLC